METKEGLSVSELAEGIYESYLDLCLSFALSEKQKHDAIVCLEALKTLQEL